MYFCSCYRRAGLLPLSCGWVVTVQSGAAGSLLDPARRARASPRLDGIREALSGPSGVTGIVHPTALNLNPGTKLNWC